MMNTTPDIDIVIRYLEEPASEENKQALDAWLQRDPSNLDIFLETKALWQGEAIPAAPAYQVELEWELLAPQLVLPEEAVKIQEVPAVRTGKVRLMRSRIWWAAAAVVVVVGGVLWLKPPALRVQQTAQHTDSLRLPDGTALYMNAHTKVKYPPKFKGNSRDLYVQHGEVFLDVAQMPEKPFVVHMEDVDVQVLGTAFDLKQTAAGVKVYVQSGKVQAYFRKTKKSVILTPGLEAYMLQAHETISTREHLKNSNVIAWKTGRLIFEDTPLSEVGEVLSNVYHVQVNIKDPSLADKKLVASFQQESLPEVLRTISKALQVEVTQKDSLVEIY
ncbi:FecR domain-containing protein [Chitinophaga pendula]|uniref:FecR family protein n=1 Tax=Chitinophaga TaxID=79328 RepID=UPI000BB01593|nr:MULTISPECIES: FecR domain-containing protein [Chitinophaga]ASZ12798.1 hypothetical protein CK934_18480 [Chitinophaga sp. MD30]UCJ09578.1 FecR domain-containing protein [Chitinophaga pendula]